MDPLRNPFSPGAGAPPPELAGRENIVSKADVLLARVRSGGSNGLKVGQFHRNHGDRCTIFND